MQASQSHCHRVLRLTQKLPVQQQYPPYTPLYTRTTFACDNTHPPLTNTSTLLPRVQPSTAVSGSAQPSSSQSSSPQELSEAEPREASAAEIQLQIAYSGKSLRRWGWVSFWIQMPLHVVGVFLQLFSAFQIITTVPTASHVFTMTGFVLGGLSSVWTFGYIALGRKLAIYATNFSDPTVEKIRKTSVLTSLLQGIYLCFWGLGASIFGLQALMGSIVGKMLVSLASAGGPDQYSGAIGVDVFLTLAATLGVISHFITILIANFVYHQIQESHA